MIIRAGANNLQERELIWEHELHLRRIQNIWGTINNKKPKKPNHLRQQKGPKPVGKKEQLIFEKFQNIQRENRILLKKMLTIDMKGSKLNPQQFKQVAGPAAYSLNRSKWVEQLTNVTSENRVSSFYLETSSKTPKGWVSLQLTRLEERLQRKQIQASNALKECHKIH